MCANFSAMRRAFGWALWGGFVAALSSSCGHDGTDAPSPPSSHAGQPDTGGDGGETPTAGQGGQEAQASGGSHAPDGLAGFGAEAGRPNQGGAGGAAGETGVAGASAAAGSPAVDAIIATEQAEPTGISLDDQYVYWGSRAAGTISRCPLAGCGAEPPDLLIANAGSVRGIELAGSKIFWARPGDQTGTGILHSCPIAGCVGAPKVFATFDSDRLNDVHVLGTTLYYAGWPLFGSCSITDCAPENRTNLGICPAVSIDTDADYLYVARHGWQTIARCNQSDCAPETFSDVLPSATMHHPISIAVDAEHLYFSETTAFPGFVASKPGLFRCPLAGCGDQEPEPLVANVHPYAIALSNTHVYYTDVEAGTVNALPKP